MDTYLKDCFATGNTQLFVGSGLSAGLYPNAIELRELLLKEPIFTDNVQDTLRTALGGANDVTLEDAAEFFELYQGPDALMRLIRKIYGGPIIKPLPGIHEKLWLLPNVQCIYTTNFDCLIEDALKEPTQPPEVITRGLIKGTG